MERGEQGIGADHELQRGREREAEPVGQQERLLPVHGNRLRLLPQLPTDDVVVGGVVPLPTGAVPGVPDESLDDGNQRDSVSARARTGVRGGQVEGFSRRRRRFQFQLCQEDEEEAGGAQDGDDADGRARLHQLAADVGGEAADVGARADQQHRRLPRRLGDEAVTVRRKFVIEEGRANLT